MFLGLTFNSAVHCVCVCVCMGEDKDEDEGWGRGWWGVGAELDQGQTSGTSWPACHNCGGIWTQCCLCLSL